jgi:hypothetical protein
MKAAAKNADFVAAVAEHFVARRGRGTMLSPADLAYLADWERAGVDAAAAIRGIDEAFRRGGDIRSLRQCDWAVEAEHRRSRAGAQSPEEGRLEEKGLAEKLAVLAAALEEAAGAAADARAQAPIQGAAAAVRKTAETAETENAATVQNELDEIEKGLFTEIEKTLPAEEAARLEREARAELRGRELDADVARRTVRAITTRTLRERFRLPSFTI